jgi:tetratricopeptide (TPR) repeat protein
MTGPPSSGALTIEERAFASVVVVLAEPGPSANAAAERVRGAATPFGARVERLPDGTLVAALTGKGSARDQARHSARCALAVRDVLEDEAIALASGRASRGSTGLVGDVIESALALARSRGPARKTAVRRAQPVLIDGTTAGLLDARFEVIGDDEHLALRRERPDAHFEATRTLLGRQMPFVGRDREIATLEGVYRRCTEERVAQAVVVTGASGVGKTRLRNELLLRIRESDPATEIWIARGDPTSAGSSLGMIAQIVRSAAGALEGETLRARQAKLTARLSRHLEGEDLARVAEFLGELAGIRFPEAKRVQLAAARRNPVLMGDQMRRAWQDFLAAECAAQPVLVILEDLHWGDLPTVTFFDGALRLLREQPLMVLALGQPDVDRLFPNLWESHALTKLPVGELPRRACEKLVREAMGHELPDEKVARLVDVAAGNPFCLEELVRSMDQGRDELPPTVLAVVQARLASLDAEARRVLRAASVFGTTFWKEGVTALLEGTPAAKDLGRWIGTLTEREFVTARPRGRFADEYAFRHAIVREAAYGSLTDEDRTLGHRLAAEWLERVGVNDAMALAEQYERGGARARAAEWYERAARHAFEANDLGATIERAEKGIACGAEGDRLGALLLAEAQAHGWQGNYGEVADIAVRALAALPPGSTRWHEAAAEIIWSRVRLGRVTNLEPIVDEICERSRATTPEPACVVAWTRAAVSLVFGGLLPLAAKLFDRIDKVDVDASEAIVVARVRMAQATRAVATGDLSAYLAHTEACIAPFELAGDLRTACVQRANAGYARMMLGEYALAEDVLRATLVSSERMGLSAAAASCRQNLGLVLGYRGALQEARAVEEAAIEALTVSGDKLMAACGCAYLAHILVLARNFEAAERSARDALVSVGERVSEVRALALATLARVLLATKRPTEAIAAAQEAMEIATKLGGFAEESGVRLMHAEALRGSGDRDGSREAIRAARKRLMSRAAKISDATMRRSFLENVPDNARTVQLASEWAADGGGADESP